MQREKSVIVVFPDSVGPMRGARPGDRVKFAEERLSYTLRAVGARYVVCTKPFNPRKTVIYTIVDLHAGIRGTEGVVFGLGAKTDEDCLEMLSRLESNKTEISRRNRIPVVIDWVRS